MSGQGRPAGGVQATENEGQPLTVARGWKTGPPESLHVMCERDVGLFSLVQQVIANIPWALGANRIPIAFFQAGTCYWTSTGYRGKDTVWEYYFEPVIATHPASSLPHEVRYTIAWKVPRPHEVGYFAGEKVFITNHFGDHPELAGRALSIPYEYEDPDDALRRKAALIIRDYLRPREYIAEKVARFRDRHFGSGQVIGVHARGTDALRSRSHPHRRGSLVLSRYVSAIRDQLEQHPDAKVFVAADANSSVEFFRKAFGPRVLACESLRHEAGDAVGWGPTGAIMPSFVARDRQTAARNGEEAVIEYLLLTHCHWLVHNGASLARTVLLARPELGHVNTHSRPQSGSSCEQRPPYMNAAGLGA